MKATKTKHVATTLLGVLLISAMIEQSGVRETWGTPISLDKSFFFHDSHGQIRLLQPRSEIMRVWNQGDGPWAEAECRRIIRTEIRRYGFKTTEKLQTEQWQLIKEQEHQLHAAFPKTGRDPVSRRNGIERTERLEQFMSRYHYELPERKDRRH